SGLMRALEKRPVSLEGLEAVFARIKSQLRATGEPELKSRALGELVMAELRILDEVAYVRFASVYRSFQDISEFKREIDSMGKTKQKRAPKKRSANKKSAKVTTKND
ncbi:MAG: ATP cone domain-containing protein, partial [Pseudomonadales bacterium]